MSRLTTVADSIAPHPAEGDQAEALRDRIGESVGGSHRIVRHLASGGMGHVFLAEHVHLGMYAAVKLPRVDHEPARQMLAHEAQVLSQLEHPHIVRVLDLGKMADGSPFVLMEYVSGLELDAWLEGCGTMPVKRGVGVLKQLACAVDYLHAQGIVHGDIKPANIIIDARAHDFVKLVDFGIAAREGLRGTRRGVMGTPAYMAPEQARGELCGPAIDVYGVAALALELFTGRPPYDYTTAQDALTAVLIEAPAMPSTRGLVMAGLDEVFQKGLHPDPAKRYAIASDFVEALEQVVLAATARRSATGRQRPPSNVKSAKKPVAAKSAPRGSFLSQRVGSSQRGGWLNRVALRVASVVVAGFYALR